MSSSAKVLSLSSDEHGPLGRLMAAQEIAAKVFEGTRSPEWVRRTIPKKIVLGHSTVRWYESDVRAYIDSCREQTNPKGERS